MGIIANTGGLIEAKLGDTLTLVMGKVSRTLTLVDGGWLSDPKLKDA